MFYEEFPIPADLAEDVQLIWGMESESPEDAFARERIVPDGIVELVFHFAEPLVTYVAGGNAVRQDAAFAISQMHEFIEIESKGEVGFIAVRFYPWGARHFFDRPVQSFLDASISAYDLWPRSGGEIRAVVARPLDWSERVARVQRFCLSRRAEFARDDREIDRAARLIRQTAGQLPIAEVCEQVGVTEKQLQRKFVAAVGTTPKIFARVSRFLHICRHMDDYRDKTLAELAQHCGYADQSHFNRDFKRFAGLTPKQFLRRDDVGYADL